MVEWNRPRLAVSILTLIVLAVTSHTARADPLEFLWVEKVPTLRFKPFLKDITREKNEAWCLVVLVGKKNALILNEAKVVSITDDYVGWNPKNSSAFYFSRVKEKAGVFEGHQWLIYDNEKRLLMHDKAIDIPLVAPSGRVSFSTTGSNSTVEIKVPAKGAKFEPPANAKFDLASIGKEAKAYVTVATFPMKAGKPTARDPKDPIEVGHANRRAVWEPFTLSLASATESVTFETEP